MSSQILLEVLIEKPFFQGPKAWTPHSTSSQLLALWCFSCPWNHNPFFALEGVISSLIIWYFHISHVYYFFIDNLEKLQLFLHLWHIHVTPLLASFSLNLDFHSWWSEIWKCFMHNNTSWVLQLVNKTTIVFFYYHCNYKFMLVIV